MGGYTVIDVETTGLVPEKHDRVVEIGVVYVSHSGEVQGHWSTLVNPGRDVGPTWLHGVSATDVMKAPTFAEIAPHLLRAVTGRIMVGHNVTFDLRFLGAEFRAGVPLCQLPLQGLCTMHWSGAFLAAPSRRLERLLRRVRHTAVGGALCRTGRAGNRGPAGRIPTCILVSPTLGRSRGR